VLWSLAKPLVLGLVLHFAMRVVIRLDIENYQLFLLAALFPWQWVSTSLGAASNAFTSNGRIIHKVPFPRHMLCAAIIAGDMAHFCVSLPVFAGFRWADGLPPADVSWLLGAPLLIGIQAAMLLGCSLIVATTNAFLRDIEQLVTLGLFLLLYVTPILYPLSMVPESLRPLILANPFAPLILAWRGLLVDGTISAHAALAGAHAAVLLALGAILYRRLGWRLAEVV
jgi:lipopolysaccharide transport system permease protein